MHPPLGWASVQVRDADHPITRALADFSLRDERYCFLDVHDGSRVLLQHHHEGREHALVWAVDREGRRAVYDALGHDVGSYTSAPRLELLRREVRWLSGS